MYRLLDDSNRYRNKGSDPDLSSQINSGQQLYHWYHNVHKEIFFFLFLFSTTAITKYTPPLPPPPPRAHTHKLLVYLMRFPGLCLTHESRQAKPKGCMRVLNVIDDDARVPTLTSCVRDSGRLFFQRFWTSTPAR